MASRFHETNASELAALKAKTRNKNTDHSTSTWVGIFKSWAKQRNFSEELSSYLPHDLNDVLVKFYAELRKSDGNNYEPSCLCVMRSALDRYLKDKKYPVSLLENEEFKESNTILEGKARELRDQGLGNRPNRALPVTKIEEEVLWESGQLGCVNPQSLINTLWWLLTQHFGLRGRQEHYPMMMEDLKFCIDDEGIQYISLSEKRTKTRKGGLHKRERDSFPKVFAIGGSRCLINLLKIFKSRRPPQLKDSGYFYLAIINKPKSNIWYKTSRMGENSIGLLMKNMKLNSPLALICPDKRRTNHSARKTVVKKLQREGIQRSDIITITGHASGKGLDSYDEGDERQQRGLSHLIDGMAENVNHNFNKSTKSQSISNGNAVIPQKENNYPPTPSLPLQPTHSNVYPARPFQQFPPLPYRMFNNPSRMPLSTNNHLPYRPYHAHHQEIHRFNPYRPTIPYRQPPVQQIFNISNCNITITADQNQSNAQSLATNYQPLELEDDINFDMNLFPELDDI